jgi:uncharacterized protein YchJ
MLCCLVHINYSQAFSRLAFTHQHQRQYRTGSSSLSMARSNTAWYPEGQCPCGNLGPYDDFTYGDCCEPQHQGKVDVDLDTLVRARYSAYALGLGSYIIKTSHPSSAEYMKYIVEPQPSLKSGEQRWIEDVDENSYVFEYLGLEFTEDAEIIEDDIIEDDIIEDDISDEEYLLG